MKPTVGMWVRDTLEEQVGKITSISAGNVVIQYPYDEETVDIESMERFEEVDPILYILGELKDIKEKVQEQDDKFEKELDDIGNVLRSNELKSKYW